MDSKKKILIIKLGALGDFIQALGPMAAIRKHHKDAQITLLTTKPFEKFAQDSKYFDEIWLDEKPKKFDLFGWLNLRKKLNSGQFDRVYDLQNNDRTALYFKLFSPTPEWSGAYKKASHSNTSKTRTAGHAFDGHVETLKVAGIDHIEIDTLDWMDDDVKDIKPKEKYMLLIPGCAPGREDKRWPAQSYAALAQHFISHKIKPIILGTEYEKTIAEDIENAVQGEVLNLISKTSLPQIVALARHAEIAVGNDTGPMHLIAATGCQCLTLFSKASNPVRHKPNGKHSFTLQRNDLKSLSVDEVIKEIESLKQNLAA